MYNKKPSGALIFEINVYNTKALKKNVVDTTNGQLIFTKNIGIASDAFSGSPIRLKAPYNTDSTARAQISFENTGQNAVVLWLDVDGKLKITNSLGDRYIIDMTKGT